MNAINKRTLKRRAEQLAQIAKQHPELFKAFVKRQKRVNVHGGSKDGKDRSAWCTELAIARAVGPWDLDPFTNERSHIEADHECILARGDDGFGDGTPGSYFIADPDGPDMHRGKRGWFHVATTTTKTWGQPGYDWVRRAFEHYAHTRWCFLLRDDPRVSSWFKRIYLASELIVRLRKCEFEPPPRVKGSSSPFPHALFYRHAEDATEAVLRRGYAVRRNPQT